MKIMFSGPSGVGKTTLSNFVAEQYNIPFITTSTKPLWDKYEITSHRELISRTIMDPQWGIDFQYEALFMRAKVIKENENFVTDRSPIDNIVYFLMQVTPFVSDSDTREYISSALATIAPYLEDDLLIFDVEFNNRTVLEDDGKRIAGFMYQEQVQNVFRYTHEFILDKDPTFWKRSYDYMRGIWEWPLEERKDFVIDQINKKYGLSNSNSNS